MLWSVTGHCILDYLCRRISSACDTVITLLQSRWSETHRGSQEVRTELRLGNLSQVGHLDDVQ